MFDAITDILWTYILIPLLVFCGLFFTVRMKGIQFAKIGEMFRQMLKSDGNRKKGEKHISSFQAFAVGLSSRIGTGNIAGVASAIFVGGPGAVFWMWIMALFGSATAFVESSLAQLFKRKGKDSFYGGPAYYMQYGLGKRWMGVIFSIIIILCFGLGNQLVQSNTLCDVVSGVTGIPNKAIAAAIGVITLAILFGGVQTIAKFCSAVAPFMALGYLAVSIYILCVNIQQLPAVFSLIVKSALGVNQVAGGMIGTAIIQGVRRGLFSNEAGEGSTPNAAASASLSHPVKQGLLQSLGVYIDTLVICTCTAFIILLSGLYTQADGIILSSMAMNYHLGNFGRLFLVAAVFLFAYSTKLGNYFYCKKNLRFLSRRDWPVYLMRIFTSIILFTGGLITLQQAWDLVDFFMALMTFLNLCAILPLSKYVSVLLNDYNRQRKQGKDPVFHRETIPQADLEAWD